jgi:hypothetical protein
MLPEFIEDPVAGAVNVSRTMEQTLPTDVPADRVPPKSAMDILPKQARKKAGAIDVSFKEPHLPIGVRMSSCDASEPKSYSLCGLAVQDGEKCTCYNYEAPFNLRTTLYLDKLMALMKLPARAFMYGQMKYWSIPIDRRNVEIFCEPSQAECTYQVHFSKHARVLQWSWFGNQPKYPFTFEGMMICLGLTNFILAPLAFSSRRVRKWIEPKARSKASLRAALCKQACSS